MKFFFILIVFIFFILSCFSNENSAENFELNDLRMEALTRMKGIKFEVNKDTFDQFVENIKGFRKVSRHNGQYYDEVDKYNNNLEYQYKYFEEINYLNNNLSIHSSYYFRDNKFKAIFLKFYFKNLKNDSILISNFFKHEHLEFLKTNVYSKCYYKLGNKVFLEFEQDTFSNLFKLNAISYN